MSRSGGPIGREDAVLLVVAAMLGLAGAAGYAAFRAFTGDAATSERWTTFGEAMLFPGLLIIVAVAAMVWLGWKANID
jgi:hypothetical protein